MKRQKEQREKRKSRLEIIFKEETEVDKIASLIGVLSTMNIIGKIESDIIINVKKKK